MNMLRFNSLEEKNITIDDKKTPNQPRNKGEIILYQLDNSQTLEVLLEDETVWLSQAQMAELFQTTRNNITMHISNIFS